MLLVMAPLGWLPTWAIQNPYFWQEVVPSLSACNQDFSTLRLGGHLGDAWQASILLTRCGHYHYKSFTMVREPWGWVATWAMYDKHPYYWRKVVIFIICLSPSTLRLGDHLGDTRPSARDYSAGDAFRQQGAHPGADDIIVLWFLVSGISKHWSRDLCFLWA